MSRQFKYPRLTPLEKFVHRNADSTSASLANQLCRSEAVVDSAYRRACAKLEKQESIKACIRTGSMFWREFMKVAEEVES